MRKRSSDQWLVPPPGLVGVYDSGPRWADRYTVYFEEPREGYWRPDRFYFALSANPDSPQGVSQIGEGGPVSENHAHKRILWEHLPQRVRRHVIERLSEAEASAKGSSLVPSLGDGPVRRVLRSAVAAVKGEASLYDAIRPGDRVTILVPAGMNRDGSRDWKRATGRVVMRGPAGWVLNLGGPHGTPGIASPDNVVDVQHGRRSR